MSEFEPDKQGAGLLFIYQPPVIGSDKSFFEVLLLKRSETSGNPGTWGLPGGNLDEGENPWEAALRECREETGLTPGPSGWPVAGAVLTKRGKNLQKHFTVFVVRVPEFEKGRMDREIMLDPKEHTDWGWFSLHELPAKHIATGNPLRGDFQLHPIVGLVVAGQYRPQLTKLLEPSSEDDEIL